MNYNQEQRFTGSALQYGGGKRVNYHMKVEDSNTQLHVTTGGGGKTGVSSSQGQRPDSFRCYECGKQGHIYVNLPIICSDAKVHTQSTSELRDATVTP